MGFGGTAGDTDLLYPAGGAQFSTGAGARGLIGAGVEIWTLGLGDTIGCGAGCGACGCGACDCGACGC